MSLPDANMLSSKNRITLLLISCMRAVLGKCFMPERTTASHWGMVSRALAAVTAPGPKISLSAQTTRVGATRRASCSSVSFPGPAGK